MTNDLQKQVAKQQIEIAVLNAEIEAIKVILAAHGMKVPPKNVFAESKLVESTIK